MYGYKDKILEIALQNDGVVSVQMAKERGISPELVRQFAFRNNEFINTSKGIYIYYADQIDTSLAPYRYFTILGGKDSFLLGGTVLGMLDLGYIEPPVFYVGNSNLKSKQYLKDKGLVKVPYFPKDDEITEYNGIKSQSVYYAILTYTDYIMPDRLLDATDKALKEGLITKIQQNQLYKKIERGELRKV
jgi:hypothetical protein